MENHRDPVISLTMSSTVGVRCLSLLMARLSSLMSMQGRTSPGCLGFLVTTHDGGDPWCGPIYPLDDICDFQFQQLGLYLGSEMKCDSAVAKGNWLDGAVDM